MLFDEPTAIAGRFTVRNTAQAVETICGQISTELKQNRDGQSVGRLVAILERLTVVQLHDLKRSHNMKASGRTKAELVAKLATRLDRGRRADFSVSPVVELTAKQQEQALVQDLRAGRDGAFDRLYEQYSGLVRRDLCRRGVSATDAADVVQETFLRASQLLDTLNPEKSLGGFLKTIASRIAIDLNRKITRRGKVRTTSLDSVAEQTTQERDDWQAPEQSEQYTMVMTVLDEQPETTKEIVRLRFFEQLTFEQIAEQLGIGVTTAKDRVRKAIGAVQERVTVECCE